jgi:hypothetical protein
MPILGLGTWKSAPGEIYGAVREAIRIGYQHIACATIHGNEVEIGNALRDAIDEGQVERGGTMDPLQALVQRPRPRERCRRPHSRWRAAVTPARRGLGAPKPAIAAERGKSPTPRHAAMNWARRLQRVFGIEIDTCVRCGGTLRTIA